MTPGLRDYRIPVLHTVFCECIYVRIRRLIPNQLIIILIPGTCCYFRDSAPRFQLIASFSTRVRTIFRSVTDAMRRWGIDGKIKPSPSRINVVSNRQHQQQQQQHHQNQFKFCHRLTSILISHTGTRVNATINRASREGNRKRVNRFQAGGGWRKSMQVKQSEFLA